MPQTIHRGIKALIDEANAEIETLSAADATHACVRREVFCRQLEINMVVFRHACHINQELRLAAEIISFGFHALDVLGQAMAADIPMYRRLRMRGARRLFNPGLDHATRQLSVLHHRL